MSRRNTSTGACGIFGTKGWRSLWMEEADYWTIKSIFETIGLHMGLCMCLHLSVATAVEMLMVSNGRSSDRGEGILGLQTPLAGAVNPGAVRAAAGRVVRLDSAQSWTRGRVPAAFIRSRNESFLDSRPSWSGTSTPAAAPPQSTAEEDEDEGDEMKSQPNSLRLRGMLRSQCLCH
ncbi:uncharacterized protein DSM5745_10998 [Aspergillus mulundensis]|uniref:Uncharacterized protein n=1 Tax=Aspergillus mulundensis TaxID=1810919 RepID=A0A3D8QBS8_9EURO|nr:hypothetical protein DSM5745_10998 [Aspergillus mulundensis]RDW59303.1 hypothetical protein DSM5745_10998 [Aspergillus mulundensis]